jgi:hypothetical protein
MYEIMNAHAMTVIIIAASIMVTPFMSLRLTFLVALPQPKGCRLALPSWFLVR